MENAQLNTTSSTTVRQETPHPVQELAGTLSCHDLATLPTVKTLHADGLLEVDDIEKAEALKQCRARTAAETGIDCDKKGSAEPMSSSDNPGTKWLAISASADTRPTTFHSHTGNDQARASRSKDLNKNTASCVKCRYVPVSGTYTMCYNCRKRVCHGHGCVSKVGHNYIYCYPCRQAWRSRA